VLLGHESESGLRAYVTQISEMYGLPSGSLLNCPEPDRYLCGGETLTLGEEQFSVLLTPGHSTGGLCYYHAASKRLLAGDVLFEAAVGRTDLPGGDYQTLMKSIKEVLLALPDDTVVLSGHGPDTTIGRERSQNPFLQGTA